MFERERTVTYLILGQTADDLLAPPASREIHSVSVCSHDEGTAPMAANALKQMGD
jgi:hypothetical protein